MFRAAENWNLKKENETKNNSYTSTVMKCTRISLIVWLELYKPGMFCTLLKSKTWVKKSQVSNNYKSRNSLRQCTEMSKYDFGQEKWTVCAPTLHWPMYESRSLHPTVSCTVQ